jgi:hypothetical protein
MYKLKTAASGQFDELAEEIRFLQNRFNCDLKK